MQRVARLRVTLLERAHVVVVHEHRRLWFAKAEARIAHVRRTLVDLEPEAIGVDRAGRCRFADALTATVAHIADGFGIAVIAHLAGFARRVRTALDWVTRVVDALLAVVAILQTTRPTGAGRTEVALGADIAVIARVGIRDAYAALGLVARVRGAEVLVVAVEHVAGALAASVALVAGRTRIAIGAQHAGLHRVLAASLGVAAVVSAGGFVVAVDDLTTALSGRADVARGAHAAVVAGISCVRQLVARSPRGADAGDAGRSLVRTDVAAHAVEVGLTERPVRLGARGRRSRGLHSRRLRADDVV